MPIDGDLPEGTIVAGRYRVLSTAGSGGMGVVYVVEHVNTGGRAALKIMRGKATERSVERFRREARASGMIQSEHVVRVTDADVAPDLEDAPFLVMELLHGEELSDRLAKVGRMSPQETVDILMQVARGLERAHAAGVVHRDLKPQNIFLHQRHDGSKVVKILDFGISRIQTPKTDNKEVTGLTRAEDILGTPSWMSPEQAMSMHHASGPPTDIWAVGLMAFRMLSGDSYWGDREAPQILTQLMMPERIPPSEIDPTLSVAFDRWFIKSCSREPERRFQNAITQVESLAAAIGAEEERLVTGPLLPRPSKPTPQQHTPATGVDHPIAIAIARPDLPPPDDDGPTVRRSAYEKAKALAKLPELVREITPEPISDDAVIHELDDPDYINTTPRVHALEGYSASILGAADPPTDPKRAPAPRHGGGTQTMPLPAPSNRPAAPAADAVPFPIEPPMMMPLPSTSERRSLEPMLQPARAGAPAWAQHLVWAVPTLVFGGVFVAGLVWLVGGDEEKEKATPPAISFSASSDAGSVTSVTPPSTSVQAPAPALEATPEEPAAPNASHTRPGKKPKPPPPSPRRDAFDTQK